VGSLNQEPKTASAAFLIHVEVRFDLGPDSLELEVEDRGKGFSAENSQRGIGLVAMRERAEIIGGTLAISPQPQGGTKVRLQIPRIKVDANGA